MKPQLANDANLDTLRYGVGVMPKIDGVRALNLNGTLTGRSLKEFEGYGITNYFDGINSKTSLVGLDGEMILGDNPASSDRLCSLTTGAIGAFKDVTEMADVHWWIFDDCTFPGDSYEMRYGRAKARVAELRHPRIHIVPLFIAHNREQLDAFIARFFEEGYEGAVIRNLNAPAKEGRPSKVTQQFVRVKAWGDAEMLVTGLTEGNENTNEAKTNLLGRTERSSAKDGMVPNGMVGSIQGTLLADYVSPITGKVLFKKGLAITISTGCMTNAEAAYYWANPDKIVGHITKFKHMIHGSKDLPRMGGYLSHRLAVDL